LGRTDPSRDDFGNDAFLAWFSDLERAVPPGGGVGDDSPQKIPAPRRQVIEHPNPLAPSNQPVINGQLGPVPAQERGGNARGVAVDGGCQILDELNDELGNRRKE